MKFPKIIHQIWFQGKNDIPEKYHKNIIKTKKILGDKWVYKIWDDSSIINFLNRLENKMYITKYNQFEYLHQKVDYARYCLLYHYGGFYVDMDAYVIQSPEFLCDMYPDTEVFLSKIDFYFYEALLIVALPSVVNNGIIYANPKSSFMLKLINEIPTKPLINISQVSTIQLTTGPRTFTQLLDGVTGVTILDSEYFEPCMQTQCNITDNTIVVHQHEGSWYNNILKTIVTGYTYIRHVLNIVIWLLIILLIIYFILKHTNNVNR